MSLRRSAFAVLLTGCTLLSACGFQLRGASDGTSIPEEWRSMYLVSGNPNSEFSREVYAQFAARGITWAENRKEARYIVKLGPERFNRQNLSINAEARAAEIELTLSARFEVDDAQGATVISDAQASVVRQMENDTRNVVGKTEEARILQGEMRTQLAQSILRQIGFFAASTR
jgi:LPS-assembly lipoprotein